MPTDFAAQKVAPMPAGNGWPRSMSVNRVHTVMLERYESRRAHGQTSAAALIDRAVTESFPRRIRRIVSHRGTVNAAIAGRSGSALLRNPAAVPRDIEHLDFSPRCQLGFLDNGFRCDRAATAYVEFHMVGYCKRFDCDEDGNACGYVCACHLDALEYTAECTVRELQPATRMRRLPRRIIRCPTCDRSIRSAADILQVVVMI